MNLPRDIFLECTQNVILEQLGVVSVLYFVARYLVHAENLLSKQLIFLCSN
jgi:hypothetical protein